MDLLEKKGHGQGLEFNKNGGLNQTNTQHKWQQATISRHTTPRSCGTRTSQQEKPQQVMLERSIVYLFQAYSTQLYIVGNINFS